MQRLKLICEARLQSHINAASVAIILALAEKHNCIGLKEACFKFLRSSTDPFVVTETEDFEYLAQSCPSGMEELNAICLARDLEMAKISQGINVPTSLNQCWAWCERWLPKGKKLWMKTGREIPVPTDTVYRINRPHTVFAGKTGNGKPTPYFRQERERNRLRDFPDRIHGSRI